MITVDRPLPRQDIDVRPPPQARNPIRDKRRPPVGRQLRDDVVVHLLEGSAAKPIGMIAVVLRYIPL